jgi:hypothetical protein
VNDYAALVVRDGWRDREENSRDTNMRRNPNRDTYKLDENPTEFGKVFIFVRLEAVVSIVMISSLPSSSVARPLLCHPN